MRSIVPDEVRWGLTFILAVYALLGAGFILQTPPGAAPDEGAHVQYVRHLVQQRNLPSLKLDQRRSSFADPNYESHQPPLYYLGATPGYLIGQSIAGDRGATNGCRIWSLVCGAVGVVLVSLIAAELVPGRPVVALTAAAFAAFLPMRLSIAAAAGNDSLTEATTSLVLLLLLRGMGRRLDARSILWLSVAVVAALLTKQSAVLLVPVAVIGIFLSCRLEAERTSPPPPAPPSPAPQVARPRSRKLAKPDPQPDSKSNAKASTPAGDGGARDFLRCSLLFAALVLVGAGWWFVRNHLLYGDPLGRKAFDWYFADTPRWEHFRDGGWTFLRYLSEKVWPTTVATFWGAFGHLDPQRPQLFLGAYGEGSPGPTWGYPPRSFIYPWLNGLFVITLVGAVVGRWREKQEATTGPGGARWGLLCIHALFVFAAYLNFNATYFQAQSRYLFPAMALLATAVSFGWIAWFRLVSRQPAAEKIGGFCLAALLAGVSIYAVLAVLGPGFAPDVPTFRIENP